MRLSRGTQSGMTAPDYLRCINEVYLPAIDACR